MRHKVLAFPQKGERFRRKVKYFFASRKVKDRLFCYIFEGDKAALLQLYNALNGTDYQDEQALKIVTLKNVVYMSMNNDVAFIILSSLNLYEHQSTDCPNMPLRFLLYIAAEFEAIVEGMDANIYGNTLIKLPVPRCVVFYNGRGMSGDEKILRLTDAFADEQGAGRESCLELTVRVLNVNYGHNEKLMGCCKRLEEYSVFVAKIEEFRQKGCSDEQAVDRAVTFCVRKGIMADILGPFRAEVKKMLLTEYDEKKTMKLFQREAREAGREEGRKEGMAEGAEAERERLAAAMLQNGIPAEKVSEIMDLAAEETADVWSRGRGFVRKAGKRIYADKRQK